MAKHKRVETLETALFLDKKAQVPEILRRESSYATQSTTTKWLMTGLKTVPNAVVRLSTPKTLGYKHTRLPHVLAGR